jgi:HSP20 family protein
MSSIIRWNPMRELAAMQSMMDRMMNDTWRGFAEDVGANALSLDVHEDDKAYHVTTEMPGVKPENINVRMHDGVLFIEGEIRAEDNQKDGAKALLQERRYGKFSRYIRLPQQVDEGKVEANFDNGVLTLTLPKAEQVQPKTIQVKVSQNNTVQGQPSGSQGTSQGGQNKV